MCWTWLNSAVFIKPCFLKKVKCLDFTNGVGAKMVGFPETSEPAVKCFHRMQLAWKPSAAAFCDCSSLGDERVGRILLLRKGL